MPETFMYFACIILWNVHIQAQVQTQTQVRVRVQLQTFRLCCQNSNYEMEIGMNVVDTQNIIRSELQ